MYRADISGIAKVKKTINDKCHEHLFIRFDGVAYGEYTRYDTSVFGMSTIESDFNFLEKHIDVHKYDIITNTGILEDYDDSFSNKIEILELLSYDIDNIEPDENDEYDSVKER